MTMTTKEIRCNASEQEKSEVAKYLLPIVLELSGYIAMFVTIGIIFCPTRELFLKFSTVNFALFVIPFSMAMIQVYKDIRAIKQRISKETKILLKEKKMYDDAMREKEFQELEEAIARQALKTVYFNTEIV